MKGRISKSLGATVVSIAALVVGAATANAATVYNNVPSPLPKNVVSLGYEATSTSEFGGQVEFAGTKRSNPTVTVVLSTWGCQEGSGKTCYTTNGATFAWPITLNVYAVEANNEPGEKLASVTETFNIPYRPSANNKKCTETEGNVGWGGECFFGKTFKITFKPAVTLPQKAILSVAYNTTNYGEHPVGAATCSRYVPSRCGYDSLNVGLEEEGSGPSVGTQPLPNYAYANSTWSAMYGEEPHGTLGTFSLANEWGGYQPLFKVTAGK